MLKQYFRDLSEWPTEVGDLKLNAFIKDKTGYTVDLNHQFDKRIVKVLEKQKIRTPGEYRDILAKVDLLCQQDVIDQKQIENLNGLLIEFDKNKSLKNL